MLAVKIIVGILIGLVTLAMYFSQGQLMYIHFVVDRLNPNLSVKEKKIFYICSIIFWPILFIISTISITIWLFKKKKDSDIPGLEDPEANNGESGDGPNPMEMMANAMSGGMMPPPPVNGEMPPMPEQPNPEEVAPVTEDTPIEHTEGEIVNE